MSYRIPSHAPNSNQVVEELRLIADADELDDLALRRLERSARALMKADAECAHTVLGAIASLQGHSEEVRHHHQIALRLSGHSAQAYRNFAVSLAELGEMTESFHMALKALDRAPGDPDVLQIAIAHAAQSGHFRQAADLCQQWSETSGGEPFPHESLMAMLASAVDSGEFTENGARRLLHIAHEVLRDANVRVVSGGIFPDPTEPRTFVHEIRVSVFPEQAVRLNEELANRIVSQADLMDDPGFRLVPTVIGTRPHAGRTETSA
jgi:tetratricopeptide (TPR) repeat protein